MKKLTFSILASTVLLASCGSVPVTGRKQLSLVSNQEVLTMSFQQYGEFISSAPISTDAKQTALVKKAGQRIATAVETYLKNNGMANEVSTYAWEFNLVKSDQVNAFCMPGGKIVIYEGILPITQDETGLAVVMGHEVAHAVAKHANERMSQQVAKEYGANIVGSAVSTSSATMQKIATTAFGVGAEYLAMLPYSRKHELEADQLGLIFMAMAGYDPNQAAAFWTRMSAGGSSGPEFMSTHPSDETRIKKIQEHLPEALKYYAGPGKISSAPVNKVKPSSINAKTSKDWAF